MFGTFFKKLNPNPLNLTESEAKLISFPSYQGAAPALRFCLLLETERLADGLRGSGSHVAGAISSHYRVSPRAWSGPIATALTTVTPADPLTGL